MRRHRRHCQRRGSAGLQIRESARRRQTTPLSASPPGARNYQEISSSARTISCAVAAPAPGTSQKASDDKSSSSDFGRGIIRVYRRGGTRGPTHLIVENLRLKRAGRRCSRALVPLKMAGRLRGSTRGPTHQFVEVLRLKRPGRRARRPGVSDEGAPSRGSRDHLRALQAAG